MADKTGKNKKGGFVLTPITLSEPIKATDGFTNLIETPANQNQKKPEQGSQSQNIKKVKPANAKESIQPADLSPIISKKEKTTLENEKPAVNYNLSENELLRILEAESLDEIYELNDVLRASSLKLYAALVRLADSRGRARVKNHELMSKAGIKGIATLYKQERWLMDLKLLEKKAKPGPHDGSSYVIHKLETLPLPTEIYEKFNRYLSENK